MQRIAQHLEPVDPGLQQHGGELKFRLTAVVLALACVVGALIAG